MTLNRSHHHLKHFLHPKISIKEHEQFTVDILMVMFGFIVPVLLWFLPLHLDAIGIPGWQIGILFSLSTIFGLLAAVEFGILNDIFSSKFLIIVSLMILALATAGFVFAQRIWLLAFIFMLLGLGRTLFSESMNSFEFRKLRQNKGINMGAYFSSEAIGVGLGLFAFGYILSLLNFNKLFIICALGLLALPLLLIKFTNTKGISAPMKVYLNDFHKFDVLVFLATIFLFTLHWGAESTSYALFLKYNISLNLFHVGVFMAIPFFPLGLSAVGTGWLVDRGWDIKKLFIGSALLSGLGYFAMSLSTNPLVAQLWRIVHELGDGAFGVFLLIGVMKLFSRERMGGDAGMVYFVATLGAFVGALVFGALGDWYGYRIPGIVSGAIAIFVGLLWIPLLRRKNFKL